MIRVTFENWDMKYEYSVFILTRYSKFCESSASISYSCIFPYVIWYQKLKKSDKCRHLLLVIVCHVQSKLTLVCTLDIYIYSNWLLPTITISVDSRCTELTKKDFPCTATIPDKTFEYSSQNYSLLLMSKIIAGQSNAIKCRSLAWIITTLQKFNCANWSDDSCWRFPDHVFMKIRTIVQVYDSRMTWHIYRCLTSINYLIDQIQ